MHDIVVDPSVEAAEQILEGHASKDSTLATKQARVLQVLRNEK